MVPLGTLGVERKIASERVESSSILLEDCLEWVERERRGEREG